MLSGFEELFYSVRVVLVIVVHVMKNVRMRFEIGEEAIAMEKKYAYSGVSQVDHSEVGHSERFHMGKTYLMK